LRERRADEGGRHAPDLAGITKPAITQSLARGISVWPRRVPNSTAPGRAIS
jgi:hypothetical protein